MCDLQIHLLFFVLVVDFVFLLDFHFFFSFELQEMVRMLADLSFTQRLHGGRPAGRCPAGRKKFSDPAECLQQTVGGRGERRLFQSISRQDAQKETRSTMSVNTKKERSNDDREESTTLVDLVNKQRSKSGPLPPPADELSGKMPVMLPVFCFLQLLYENHNRNMQNFLRSQSNKSSYSLVSETLARSSTASADRRRASWASSASTSTKATWPSSIRRWKL